ncbi:phosphoribosylaminoimidazole carboxylase [Ancylostoma duodenale]|uniref:Phosphoribosylaminoimidazole carboxylase n=1 Tax=Ancylostoma duodenale TaxID=51022 RepID=A0A0C2CXF2_9BILA|nr:phosphoribosylaminoimidazole carboxylase [Ancylostoma duodenale]
MDLTAGFSSKPKCQAVIIMGSPADLAHCEKIAGNCKALGITPILHVSSAHKTTRETLNILAKYEDTEVPTVIIAVAGRSNGLGPVLAGNTSLPILASHDYMIFGRILCQQLNNLSKLLVSP